MWDLYLIWAYPMGFILYTLHALNTLLMMFIKVRLKLKLPSDILEADKIAYVYKTCDLGKRGKWVKLPKSQD